MPKRRNKRRKSSLPAGPRDTKRRDTSSALYRYAIICDLFVFLLGLITGSKRKKSLSSFCSLELIEVSTKDQLMDLRTKMVAAGKFLNTESRKGLTLDQFQRFRTLLDDHMAGQPLQYFQDALGRSDQVGNLERNR